MTEFSSDMVTCLALSTAVATLWVKSTDKYICVNYSNEHKPILPVVDAPVIKMEALVQQLLTAS